MRETTELLEAQVLSDRDWIAIETLCRLCDLNLETMVELAELGIVSPRGYPPDEWQLPATALPRLRIVGRLIRDLGVNVSGAALAVELLDAQRHLEHRLRELERHIHSDSF
jgi:chaperone modulatory protein CbpM